MNVTEKLTINTSGNTPMNHHIQGEQGIGEQMRWIKWIVTTLLIVFIVAVLHYTLQQRDIVRITNTDILRPTLSGWNRIFYARPDGGNAAKTTRDVRLINAIYPNGKVIVYRNEDTGWFRWPPYFKTDSSDVSAIADNLKSTAAEPQWVSIKHYGWRFSPLSIYPNAISIKPVSDPDASYIPWFNIIFFIIIGLFGLGIFRLLQRFKRRRIDPVLEDIEDAWDDAGDNARGFWGRIRDKLPSK